MHSAIVYAVLPTDPYEARQKEATFLAATYKLEQSKAAKKLGNYVWQIDFRAAPDALAVFVTGCEQLAIPYGILPLDGDPTPQWIVRP